MDKFGIFKKGDDRKFDSTIYNTSAEIFDMYFWNSDLQYIVQFKDGENIDDFQIPGINVTCTTEQSKDEIVTDYTFEFDYTIYNGTIDNETFSLIKNWCSGQAEGCEEAFLNLGIANSEDERYQAYVAEKSSIKSSQAAKKKGV